MKTLNGSYSQQFKKKYKIKQKIHLHSHSFYFQNTLLTLLRFPNMSHVDTKFQRLLIPSLLSEKF